MAVLDAIDALPFVSLGAKAPNAPYFSEFYDNPSSFVYMNVEVTERFSTSSQVYESGTGLLITSVNIDDGSELLSLNLRSLLACHFVETQSQKQMTSKCLLRCGRVTICGVRV